MWLHIMKNEIRVRTFLCLHCLRSRLDSRNLDDEARLVIERVTPGRRPGPSYPDATIMYGRELYQQREHRTLPVPKIIG